MKKLVFLMMCVGLLSACTVDSQRIEWGEHVCSQNGGIDGIRRSGFYFTIATCKNGATFDGYDFK